MSTSMDDLLSLFSLVEDTREDDLAWAFAICEYMAHNCPDDIPASWEFRHAPSCQGEHDSWPDSELLAMNIDTSTALHFGWYLKGRLEARGEEGNGS